MLYDIICGLSHDLSRVYGIPRRDDYDQWFLYEGPQKVNTNTRESELIDFFDVPATRSGLIFVSMKMGEELHSCGPNVTCRQEASKRLAVLKPERPLPP